MNVVCVECRSVFRVDPDRVPVTGVRARCSVCGGVIVIAPPTPSAQQPTFEPANLAGVAAPSARPAPPSGAPVSPVRAPSQAPTGATMAPAPAQRPLARPAEPLSPLQSRPAPLPPPATAAPTAVPAAAPGFRAVPAAQPQPTAGTRPAPRPAAPGSTAGAPFAPMAGQPAMGHTMPPARPAVTPARGAHSHEFAIVDSALQIKKLSFDRQIRLKTMRRPMIRLSAALSARVPSGWRGRGLHGALRLVFNQRQGAGQARPACF